MHTWSRCLREYNGLKLFHTIKMNAGNKVKKVFGSKIFENLSNQTILYGFSHLIPLVLLPFLLNVIGVEKYGVINFAISFGFYFQVVNEFGFDLSNVSHVVDNRENKQKLSEILSAILQCKFYMLFVSAVVFFSIVLSVNAFRQELVIYILAFIRMIGIVISPLWLFRSMEEIKYVTRITMPIKILLTLPIFLIVRDEGDYWWVMFFFAVESFVSGIVALVVALCHYDLHIRFQKSSVVTMYFMESMPFFISTFLYRSYRNFNPFVIGLIFGDVFVGIYSASEKLHNAYASFLSPIINQVFYPFFQRIKDFRKIGKIIGVMIVGNVCMLAAVCLLIHLFLGFFIHENVSDIIYYLDMLLIVLAISVPNDLLGFPYLGVLGKIGDVTKSALYAAIAYFVTVGISIIFCPSIVMLIFALAVANIVGLIYKVVCIHRSSSVERH